MKSRTLLVGMTYDLRDAWLAEGYSELETAEFDRADTIDSIEAALIALGYAVDRIGNVRQLAARLVAGDRWDIVFNICEGMHGIGREAQVPALLDAWQIPYVFSDTLVCALTLHKGMTKHVVRDAGVPTSDFKVAATPAEAGEVRFSAPYFVKPVAEGTGKGVTERSRIDTPEQLAAVCEVLRAQFAQPVLVEEYLPGREFTTAILGNGAAAQVLGTMEIEILPHAGRAIYSYENKEKCEQLVRYSPLSAGPLRRSVERLALRSYQVLQCRDAARVDIRCDGRGRPSFLEVNPLPGLHPVRSDLPIMARLAGIAYDELLSTIVESARERAGLCSRAA